jgi:DUF971 family protein
MSTIPPSRIRPDHERHLMLIDWQDGEACELTLKELRGACACAMCVDEVTGERLLDVDSIPYDIAVREMSLVGNYALRIAWSDGHDTGLFTWQRLGELCQRR